jgi:hypothetical protein
VNTVVDDKLANNPRSGDDKIKADLYLEAGGVRFNSSHYSIVPIDIAEYIQMIHTDKYQDDVSKNNYTQFIKITHNVDTELIGNNKFDDVTEFNMPYYPDGEYIGIILANIFNVNVCMFVYDSEEGNTITEHIYKANVQDVHTKNIYILTRYGGEHFDLLV